MNDKEKFEVREMVTVLFQSFSKYHSDKTIETWVDKLSSFKSMRVIRSISAAIEAEKMTTLGKLLKGLRDQVTGGKNFGNADASEINEWDSYENGQTVWIKHLECKLWRPYIVSCNPKDKMSKLVYSVGIYPIHNHNLLQLIKDPDIQIEMIRQYPEYTQADFDSLLRRKRGEPKDELPKAEPPPSFEKLEKQVTPDYGDEEVPDL